MSKHLSTALHNLYVRYRLPFALNRNHNLDNFIKQNLFSEIYIVQNTLGGSGVGNDRWGKKRKVRGEKRKGERKTEENYIQTGKTALKMHLFGL